MKALKEVTKVAKALGISSFKKSKDSKKVPKSAEELQREINKKIVKQQAEISKNFIKTCKQVFQSLRSKKKQQRVPRFEPQIPALVPPMPTMMKAPPPPPPPPPPLKKKGTPRKSGKSPKSPPKPGLREQLMKELKNKIKKRLN